MAAHEILSGNVAIAQGAIRAGCRHYFGYPITPQSDVVEYFAQELPKIGGYFVQTESESSSINMLYGAAATGVRAMTSSSSTGFSLMMECLSTIASAELPCVIMNVQRGGPGAGTTQTSQMDYLQATKGGGHGDYRMIVLAPSSPSECFELIQLAFHLADKYRNPTMILSDAMVGQMMEKVSLRALAFGPLPQKKDWALKIGRASKKREAIVHNAPGIMGMYFDYLTRVNLKYQTMAKEEVRYEAFQIEDAQLILIAYGSTARSCLGACQKARELGLKVGVIRPISLWPFPTQVIREAAGRTSHFLVVEDCLGQMVEDVESAVQGKSEIHFLGILARHLPTSNGMILPKRILEEVRKIL